MRQSMRSFASSNGSQLEKTTMKRVSALTLMIFAAASHVLPAIEKDKAAYAGGTIAGLDATGGPIRGRIDTSDPDRLVFVADEHPLANVPLRVEYAAIHHVEFGQQVRRRVPAAVGAAVLLGPKGLVALRSKHRMHYLTVAYRDGLGANQVVVLELGKSIVRETLGVIEASSGKPVEYQDEEARKWR
jgi:hypothetical protein